MSGRFPWIYPEATLSQTWKDMDEPITDLSETAYGVHYEIRLHYLSLFVTVPV
jgi:hypothetical protein